jgi:hypothetical protein
MTVQSVTIELPQNVYEQIEQAAQKRKRPLDQLLVEAVTAVAPVLDTAPLSLRSALAQLAYLNDAALWQAARTSMPPEQRTRLEQLHHKAQKEGLTQEEKEEEEERLLKLYRETLLVRAQAAVLLSQRQYDVSDLSQYHL